MKNHTESWWHYQHSFKAVKLNRIVFWFNKCWVIVISDCMHWYQIRQGLKNLLYYLHWGRSFDFLCLGRSMTESIKRVLTCLTDRQQTSNVNVSYKPDRKSGDKFSYLFSWNKIYLVLRLVNLSAQGYLLQLDVAWRPLTGLNQIK